MRMRLFAASCAVCAASLLCGCDDGGRAKPEPTGVAYELVLIVPEQIYSGELKDTLVSILEGSTPLLPQHEPMFRLSVIHSALKEYNLFRSRLIVTIDPKSDLRIDQMANTPAANQVEVRVTGPDAHSLAEFLGANRQQLTDLFVENELRTEMARLQGQHAQMVTDSMQHQFGHTIYVPVGIRASKLGKDFFWAGTNLNDKDLNYVYYSYPWNGEPLAEADLVAMRDSILRINIPGAQPGQYMQTSRYVRSNENENENDNAATSDDGEGIPMVVSRARIINNVYVMELRGLWDVRGAALGGAFISQARIDTAAQRVLVNEGFIYSPHSPKRALLRQMEAAIRTFK